jgi:hypothetical protein
MRGGLEGREICKLTKSLKQQPFYIHNTPEYTWWYYLRLTKQKNIHEDIFHEREVVTPVIIRCE